MHILLVSVSRATSPTGVCRHAANLARAFCGTNVRVTLVVGTWQERYFREALALDETEVEVVSVSLSNTSLGRNWFYAVTLARSLLHWEPDVLHLSYPTPVLPSRWSGVKTIVSLHDLYALDAPEVFGGRRAWANRLATLWGLRSADAIAAVSQVTLRRLQAMYPAFATKARVIPNAVLWNDGTAQGSAAVEPAGGYLLCVAQHRVHKRLDVLLETFAELRKRGSVNDDTRLTIVGERGPETERLRALEEYLLPTGAVCWKRGVSDAELGALYCGALALVAPSGIEGFGLPVAEALAVGCRVVCSRIDAHREVAADSATYFSVDADASEIANAVERSLRQDSLVKQRPGICAKDMAARYLELYNALTAPSGTVEILGQHFEERADGGACERTAR